MGLGNVVDENRRIAERKHELCEADAWETQARADDALALEHEEEARQYKERAKARRELAKQARARAAALE